MNTVMLNTVHLDGAPIIKKGGGGVPINNQSKSVEFTENGTSEVRYDAGYTGLEKVSVKVAIPTESKSVTITENGSSEVSASKGYLDKVSINVAIPNEEKTVDITENGTTEVVADNGFLSRVVVNTNVASSGGGSGWTGHADAEGLRAIGWTDEDIAYYQENGVNWNAEDDEYHKVTDDNKALYGVLTANNISTYKARIVYLPKIDTSAKTDMSDMFSGCRSLVAIPQLDTSNATIMSFTFAGCRSLVSIPQLDTVNVTDIVSVFNGCSSLVSIPQLDTSNVKDSGMSSMFRDCHSLVSIPQLDTSNAAFMGEMFYNCYSLISIPQLETSKVTGMERMFYNCYSLTHVNIKNAKLACDLSMANLLSKESLLYLINNEAATSAITIKLASYAYTRLAEDADVVAALAAHPNISLAK